MKKILNILIVTISIVTISCVAKRKSSVDSESNIKYDNAAFDYVYVEALKQKLLGNGGDALKYLDQCVKLNPSSDAAYYQMAQILLSTGDIKNGKNYAKKAYNLDNTNVWYIMMLSGIYYQQGNIDSAIIIYEKSVNLYPDKQNIQIALANLYSEEKDYDKSLKIYQKLEEKYGINESTTYGYVQNLMLSGKLDQALLKTEDLIKMFPSGIQYYALLAEIYGEKGDKEKAREVYQKLLEENPDNVQIQVTICDFLINEKKFDDLFMILNPLIINNNVKREDKISLFAKLIENKSQTNESIDKTLVSLMVLEAAYPNDDVIPLLRPEFLSNINRDNEAISRLEEIITWKPSNYFAWEKLLLLYLQTKDYEKLMVKGEECASKFNMSFLAKLLYANGALENKKYNIALEELKKAEILAGNNNEYFMQVLTMRADVYYRMKDFSKAFETYDAAIKLNGEDLTLLNNYAYYLAEQNMNLKEAEIMARKVIEKESANNTFLDTYAWVLYKRGKIKDAAKIMETILASDSDLSSEYYEHYGFILKSLKRCSDAIDNWSIAIKLDSTKNTLNKEIENCRAK